MRYALPILALLLVGCGPDTPPQAKPKAENGASAETAEKWYAEALAVLVDINRALPGMIQAGKSQEASQAVMRGEAIAKELLQVPRPSLAAARAASDLDQAYGDMLFSDKQYGWARLQYQKNLSRWKYWKPQTPETESLAKLARDKIAECDKHIKQ